MKQIKAQGLPVNVVVMMIIGIVIFGLGMGLFSKISESSEEIIGEKQDEIRKQIAFLECDGDDWICSPTNKVKNEKTGHFSIVIANKGLSEKEYDIEITTNGEIDGKSALTRECGSIQIFKYPNSIKVESGDSENFPFSVIASNVNKLPCSFTTTAILKDVNSINDDDNKKTLVIIKVE